MDRPWIGDQHHEKSDRANSEISNSRALVGTGGEDEKTKNQTLGGMKVTLLVVV